MRPGVTIGPSNIRQPEIEATMRVPHIRKIGGMWIVIASGRPALDEAALRWLRR